MADRYGGWRGGERDWRDDRDRPYGPYGARGRDDFIPYRDDYGRDRSNGPFGGRGYGAGPEHMGPERDWDRERFARDREQDYGRRDYGQGPGRDDYTAHEQEWQSTNRRGGWGGGRGSDW